MIRALIVDDEPLARKLIKEYLEEFAQIRLIGECRNGRQAVKMINQEKPDLVFLDVRMPGMDGFEVLEHLSFVPRIIFSTAYNDFALRAFEVNAVDYLLKPYDRKRFAKSLERVLHPRLMPSEKFDRIIRLLQDARQTSDYPSQIFVRVGRKIVAVQTAQILWIEADGDYTKLHTADTSYLCNLSLNVLEGRLEPSRFVRVHRSFLIARDAVKQLAPDGEGGYVATLTNNSRVRISRTYAPRIKNQIW